MTAELDRDIARNGLQMTLEDATGNRLDRLIAEAHGHIDRALETSAHHEVTGVVGLFSGGNDSTVLAHLVKDRVTHYVHANTQVGAEPTRQFVRDTASGWNVPLLEGDPPSGHGYEDLVLRRVRPATPRGKREFIYPGGFPGWPDHRVMFGWLKDRWLRKVRAMFCPHPTRQRVIFINGVRASESAGRWQKAQAGTLRPVKREGSVVRVAPLLNWTKLDLNDYRRRFPSCPRNAIADWMHMSLECACGSSAKPGELDFMAACVPTLADYLRDLQDRVRREARRQDWDMAPERLTWGWWNKGGRCLSGACNI